MRGGSPIVKEGVGVAIHTLSHDRATATRPHRSDLADDMLEKVLTALE